MWIFAFFCIGIGVYPQPLYAILPFPVEFAPYTAWHLVSQFQLLLFAGLAFFVLLPWMQRTLTITLDWDWLYRRLGPTVGSGLTEQTAWAQARLEARTQRRLESAFRRLYRHHGPQGEMARTWPVGSMVMWAVVLLATYLIFSLV